MHPTPPPDPNPGTVAFGGDAHVTALIAAWRDVAAVAGRVATGYAHGTLTATNLTALKTVITGACALQTAFAHRSDPPAPITVGVPRRQHQILTELAKGYLQNQIAEHLGLSPHTVKTHIQHLYRALGARNAAHAVSLALHAGILH